MVAWFIIAIATLAVFAFIAVNGVQTVATTSDAAGRVETTRRLDAAVNALLTRAVDVGGTGTIFLPAGQNNPTGQGYGLPDDLATMAVTPFGQRFVYCPFGVTGGTGTSLTIPQATGAAYTVGTEVANGRAYVVGGRPNYPGLVDNPNVMAFVLAPRTKLSPVPNCSDVTYDVPTKKFGATNAIVRVVTRDGGVDQARTVSSRTVTYHVTPGGNGTGASEGDPSNLATALAFYRSNLPSAMTIKLATGNYVIQPTDLNIPEAPGRQANLSIEHRALQANMASIDMNGPGNISIPGNLSLDAVMLDSDTTLLTRQGRTTRIKNSTVGAVTVYGTTIFAGTNVVNFATPARYAIIAAGGSTLQFASSSTRVNTVDYGIYVLGGARMSADSSVIQFARTSGQLSYGFYIAGEANVDLSGGQVQFLSSVFYSFWNEGNISMNGTEVHYTSPSQYGIYMSSGSRANLFAAKIGLTTRLVYGISDVGAQSIAGNPGTEIFAGTCWTGAMFQDSVAPTPGSSSSVQGPTLATALPASPTGAQIQAYADTQAINARRTVLSQINRSDWRCR